MILESLKPETALKVKKYGYFIYLLPLLLPVSAWYGGTHTQGLNTLFALLPMLVVFVIVPIVDLLLGKDPVNPDEDEVPEMSEHGFYRWLTLSCLPLYFLCIFSAGYFMLNWPGLSVLDQVLYTMSVGVVGGIIAINVGHELIHKNTKLEQISGGLLLSLVSYAGFKVEHVYGHHVHVSTPEDASSSRYNQSLYDFLPKAYYHNFKNAWKIQKQRMERKGQRFLGIKNELIWYYLHTVLVAGLMGVFFEVLGASFWIGVGFFFLQSFIAFTELEVINYIEHYGLHRRKMSTGKYERVTPEHSWNSNYFLTNMFLFQLQRHSDHHAFAARRYQVLRHHENSPQLPFGYATMFTLAWFPPLWKAVMNPRVKAYYRDEEGVLSSS
ncbi:probable alkane hydroxylase [Oceanobacter sp. RED65]|uniref:Probable alkane hydroxylase n=1 Tax=Bermanella marisrubri TaxID=207949 RepID=Q1N2C6_9GAMM|nr:probable alkane hydroxylase [Oceanobacter sp. RED65] [Bermanella marisrubri]